MDTAQFWQLIEVSKNKRGNCDKQAEKLQKLLTALTAEEIAEFDFLFDSMMALGYRWDWWAVGYIVNISCSDDGFEYFRCWIIAQGQTYFEAALQNPERAADAARKPEYNDGEQLLYAAGNAYEAKTGSLLPIDTRKRNFPADPLGEPWKSEDLETLFPALCAKFG